MMVKKGSNRGTLVGTEVDDYDEVQPRKIDMKMGSTTVSSNLMSTDN